MSSFQHDHKGHKPAHEIVRPQVMVIDTDVQSLTLVVKYPKTELLQPPWIQGLVFVLKIHVNDVLNKLKSANRKCDNMKKNILKVQKVLLIGFY